MNYYFSLVFALGITIFNSGQGNLALDSRTSQNQTNSQLITQLTETNADLADNRQAEDNSLESSVESKSKNLNQNLLLSAIAATSIFSVVLLILLFRKVEINLDEEASDSQAEKVLDDTVIVEKPESLANNSVDNHHQSSKQTELQDTVLIAPQTSTCSAEHSELQDTAIVPQNNSNSAEHQEQSQDTVIVSPHINPVKISTATSEGVPELIRELQNGDRKIRLQIIEKLSQSNDSHAMIPLVELITEADPQEKSLILAAMREITSSILKPMNQALLLSLGDENSQVKQNAIRDLTRIYEVMSQVTERLSYTISDSEQKLPETAQWALKQLQQMPETPTWQLANPINNGKMITDN